MRCMSYLLEDFQDLTLPMPYQADRLQAKYGTVAATTAKFAEVTVAQSTSVYKDILADVLHMPEGCVGVLCMVLAWRYVD